MTKVSVLKCDSYDVDLIYETIKQSLKNINYEIPKNKKVLLKPNVLGQKAPDTAICTHPAILDALCKLLKENNNEIWIGDSSGISSYGGTRKAFEVSGIKDVADKHNAKLISFEGSERKEIDDKDAVILKHFIMAKEPFMADIIINLPKLKTHMLMKYTGAVKNMFGCIPGGGKSEKHALAPREDDFANVILDIYKQVIPNLNIMDAIVGLEGQGPGSAGKPKKAGLIIASENAIALDMVASRIIGYDPYTIKTNSHGIERGFLKGMPRVIGEDVKVDFKKPSSQSGWLDLMPKPIVRFIFNFTAFKPYTKKNLCKKCAVCATACPKKAISMKPYPVFNRKKCVLCYCCHEHCPYNAIALKKSVIFRLMEGMKTKTEK